MGALTLILGGARSGKSTYAEQLAQLEGGDQVLYVATAQARDEEMRERILKHRQSRPAGWHTLEIPRYVGQAIVGYLEKANRIQAKPAIQVVLLDCLTLLVSNCMESAADPFDSAVAAQVEQEITQFLDGIRRMPVHFIVVSNEVGMGLVPTTPLGRAYRDLLGRANRELAQAAATVILMVAGLPLFIKGEK